MADQGLGCWRRNVQDPRRDPRHLIVLYGLVGFVIGSMIILVAVFWLL
jgi:hypothetical protein